MGKVLIWGKGAYFWTLTLGQKGCAYYGKSAYYECAGIFSFQSNFFLNLRARYRFKIKFKILGGREPSV